MYQLHCLGTCDVLCIWHVAVQSESLRPIASSITPPLPPYTQLGTVLYGVAVTEDLHQGGVRQAARTHTSEASGPVATMLQAQAPTAAHNGSDTSAPSSVSSSPEGGPSGPGTASAPTHLSHSAAVALLLDALCARAEALLGALPSRPPPQQQRQGPVASTASAPSSSGGGAAWSAQQGGGAPQGGGMTAQSSSQIQMEQQRGAVEWEAAVYAQVGWALGSLGHRPGGKLLQLLCR